MVVPFPEITNPTDPRVTAAITWSCDICKAKRGQPCTCPICDQPLTVHGRIVHYGRLIDRRRENKEDEC